MAECCDVDVLDCHECATLRDMGLYGGSIRTLLTERAEQRVKAQRRCECGCMLRFPCVLSWVVTRIGRMTHADHVKYGLLAGKASSIMKFATWADDRTTIRRHLLAADPTTYVYDFEFRVLCLRCAQKQYSKNQFTEDEGPGIMTDYQPPSTEGFEHD